MRRQAAAPIGRGAGCCLLGLLVCLAADAHAQQGSLRGVVRDSAGRALEQAVIMIDSLDLVARSDVRGGFYFDRLPKGEHGLMVRRLGFEPKAVRVIITAAGVDEVLITLRVQPTVLSPISTREERRRQGILEFHQRRERGVGTFITREQILERGAAVPSDMLRAMPGIRFVSARTGRGVRFLYNTSILRRDCMPMMWIDGARAPGMELDDLPVHDIEGIELYQGPSTTPMQFSPGPAATCGTIVVWTRQPGH